MTKGFPGQLKFHIQLRTTEVNEMIRIFDENLTTDLTLDRQKEHKKGLFMLFPQHFGCTKFLSKIFQIYMSASRYWWPQKSEQLGSSRYQLPSVLFLLAHCPCSSSTCQILTVSIHKPPRLIYEVLDNLFWTFFKEALYCFLDILEAFFLCLLIMIFAPPLVLIWMIRFITHLEQKDVWFQ